MLNLLSQVLTRLDRFFSESAMGHSVGIAPGCTRASGAAMHAAAFFPLTAGARQSSPLRVFAPQRGLWSIGPKLRLWVPGISQPNLS